MNNPMSELPLQSKCQDGILSVAIGLKTLRWVAENHPYFWDGESGTDTPNIKITDEAVFAQEVVEALNREEENGGTLITEMLDEAIKQAVENGCDGVDHDD
jgi:hypothetical protein